LLLILPLCAMLAAHEFSQSESALVVDGPSVTARIDLNLLEFPDVDADRNGIVSYEELDAAIERIFAALKQHYVLGAPEAPVRILAERHEIVDEHVLQINVRFSFAHDVRRLDVTSTLDALFGPMHQHFVTATMAGEAGRTVLDAGNPHVSFDQSRVIFRRTATVVGAVLVIAGLVWFRRRR
jgi:hypothetical protein